MGDKKIKAWADDAGGGTPITAAELIRMESRNRDLRWNCPAAWTSVDEFDDDTIHGDYVRVDKSGGSGRAEWAEGGDALSVKLNGGDAAQELHAQLRPLSGFGGALAVGDAIVTALTITGPAGTNYVMVGPVLADGTTFASGTQVGGLVYSQTGYVRVDTWSFSGFQSGTGDAGMIGPFGATGLFVRLVKLAGNVWRTDISSNGVLWVHGSGTLTAAFTPTQVGVMASSWGTATKSVTAFEFIRRVSGVS